MTQWIENPEGGRERGPVGIARAWIEVLVRPRRFFEAGVAPGDQAPGLVFAIVVVLGEELTRILLTDGANPLIATIGASGPVERVLVHALWLGLVVMLLMLVLHLVASVATVLLMVLVEDRGGVSETVQVLAYATAPCLLVGIPVLELQALAGIYGAYLLYLGIGVVHRAGTLPALVVWVVPASVVFGYGFRAFAAVGLLFRQWYII